MAQSTSTLTIFKAGLAYFGIVFGTGFVLGTVRVLLLVPRVGERIAELIEMPLMLAVMILAARWVVGRFQVPRLVGQRLAIGLTALILVVLLDFTVVLGLRGLPLSEYFQTRDPVSGTVYYVMLGVFALLPYLVGQNHPPELHIPDLKD